MSFLTELWLPIVLSAVLVFIVSSIIHMVIPIHKGDFRQIPGEGNVLAEMRTQNVAPGSYVFPYCASMKDMGSPEMIEKYKEGPVGFLTVLPSGTPKIGKNLVQWFVFSLLIGVISAYVAYHAVGTGPTYLAVFRITGTVATVGYAVSNVPDSIWKGASWGTTLKFVFDGVIYGLVTAGTFGWLWPK